MCKAVIWGTLCGLLLLIASPSVLAQDLLFVRGAALAVENNGVLYIEGGVHADNSGGTAAVSNDGDLMVMTHAAAGQENWTNNGNPTLLSGNGTVTLGADGNQDITGSAPTTFFNLTLDGAGTNEKIQVGVDAFVNGTLDLNDEILRTNTNSMTVNNPATNAILRSGPMAAPWNSSTTQGMVMSSGAGKLIRATNSTGAYAFPTGSNLVTPRFRPVTLRPHNASAQSYGVRMVNNDATTDGLDRNDKETSLLNLNSRYYHKITRLSGSGNSDISIWYDDVADGGIPYEKIAEWTFNDPGATPEWWEDLNDAVGDMTTTMNSGPLLSAVTRLGYPYAYNTENFILEEGSAPFPVTLLSFTGENQGGRNRLDWHTATESGNALFTLEKSEDGRVFKVLEEIEGAGTTTELHSYQAYDPSPFALTFYRLKQTDFNGQSRYSATIQLAMDPTQGTETIAATVFPNPASDALHLRLEAFSGVTDMQIEIFGLNGQRVKSETVTVNGAGIYANVIDVSDLSAGMYVLQLQQGAAVWRQRLVIKR